jgi:cytidylate kinase
MQIAATRILADMDDARLESEHVHRDPVEYAQNLQRRLDSETRRYRSLYNIDPYNLDNYDLVIDTAEHSMREVVRLVVDGYRAWCQ